MSVANRQKAKTMTSWPSGFSDWIFCQTGLYPLWRRSSGTGSFGNGSEDLVRDALCRMRNCRHAGTHNVWTSRSGFEHAQMKARTSFSGGSRGELRASHRLLVPKALLERRVSSR
ncbi:hypothetical protein [Nonomuraea sp. NPDC049129]|uniref:hypothetical protein n=1 Tax=Nonomuraea sp. NPDC049129 TaxID=3155272 RepID=UPI0033F132D3